MSTKRCSLCREDLPLDAFGITRGKPRSRCKRCAAVEEKARRDRDPDAARAKKGEWRARHAERLNAEGRAAYAANPEKYRAAKRAWTATNLDRLRPKWLKAAADNREAARRKAKAWYLANAERAKRNARRWRQANADKARARTAERRAKKRGAFAERFGPEEIFRRDSWRCGICGGRVDRRLRYPHVMSASVDHIVPLAEGGAHVRANVQCAHLRCNVVKQAGKGGQLRLFG